MRAKKFFCTVLVLVSILSCFCVTAGAVEVSTEGTDEYYVMDTVSVRATGPINMSIPANAKLRADTSFPMEVGDTVIINASYSPRTASVDFGLVGPDGKFHFINVKNGSINKGIQVDQRGNYTLQIRNNSANPIRVSGFVSY